MRYRIKDPNERKGFDSLVGSSEWSTEEIEQRHWEIVNGKLHFDIRDTVEVEPVKEVGILIFSLDEKRLRFERSKK